MSSRRPDAERTLLQALIGASSEVLAARELGETCRFRRLTAGFTITAAAQAIRVERMRLVNFERGASDLPSRKVFAALALYGCTIRIGQPEPPARQKCTPTVDHLRGMRLNCEREQ